MKDNIGRVSTYLIAIGSSWNAAQVDFWVQGDGTEWSAAKSRQLRQRHLWHRFTFHEFAVERHSERSMRVQRSIWISRNSNELQVFSQMSLNLILQICKFRWIEFPKKSISWSGVRESGWVTAVSNVCLSPESHSKRQTSDFHSNDHLRTFYLGGNISTSNAVEQFILQNFNLI